MSLFPKHGYYFSCLSPESFREMQQLGQRGSHLSRAFARFARTTHHMISVGRLTLASFRFLALLCRCAVEISAQAFTFAGGPGDHQYAAAREDSHLRRPIKRRHSHASSPRQDGDRTPQTALWRMAGWPQADDLGILQPLWGSEPELQPRALQLVWPQPRGRPADEPAYGKPACGKWEARSIHQIHLEDHHL